jgi:vacuolar-type H+-ATPase subunit H
MPETMEPPKKSFASTLAATRPSTEAEFKAMEAAPAAPAPVTPAPAPKPAPEAAAPSPAPAEVVPDPDGEILAGKRTPKNEDFKRIKHAAEEASKRAEQFEKEISELKRAPKHNAEIITKLEKERDEFKGRWERVAVEFQPEFHAKYDGLVAAAIDRVKDALPSDRVDKLKQLMVMPDNEWKRRAMAELTEDLDAPTLTKIMLADERVADIMADRKRELSEAAKTLNAIGAEHVKKQEARKAQFAQVFDEVISRAAAEIPVFQTKTGDSPEVKEWNDGVAERTRVARALFMGEATEDADKAEASLWAASAPGFLKQLKAVTAERDEALATLAKVQSVSPGFGKSTGKAGEAKMTFTERMTAGTL